MIDLCGPIAQVYCQVSAASCRRCRRHDVDAVSNGDMSGYLGTMTATGGLQLQVFGSKGRSGSRA
jgi:hypothetical protein